MADDLNDTTRIDELGATLTQQLAQVKKDNQPPDRLPMFIRHSNGSVFTRDGREVRGPLPPAEPPATGSV